LQARKCDKPPVFQPVKTVVNVTGWTAIEGRLRPREPRL
jgi:hypothetical protein